MGSLRTLRKIKGETFSPEETSSLTSEIDKAAECQRLSRDLASLNRQLTSTKKAMKYGLWIACGIFVSLVGINLSFFFSPFSWFFTIMYIICTVVDIYVLKSWIKERSYYLNEIKILKEEIQSTEEQLKKLA